MILLILFAFIAGIVTILSPCILPVLPIILSSSVSGAEGGRARPFGVVAGFVGSFTLFTLFLSTIVQQTGISADSLRLVALIVIGILGFVLLIPNFQVVLEKLFSRLSKHIPKRADATFFSGVLIGVSLGLLWTPCVGPILASVITLALTGSVTFNAFLITLSYSLGTAIPMFMIILGGQKLFRSPWLMRNTAKIQQVFGIIMILTAVGIYFNIDRKFQTYILKTFPQYGAGLTSFEDNEFIKQQLDRVRGKNLEPLP